MTEDISTPNLITDGSLTTIQKARYARHIMLPQVGEKGQE